MDKNIACLVWLVLGLCANWTSGQRTACGNGDAQPTTRVNTTERLQLFRTEMASLSALGQNRVEAFIVGSADAHNSEYPTDYDQRRAFMSGFSGSAGTAVITETKAALWTDGRYYLEADEMLDCNWELMRSGLADTPTIVAWLDSELNQGALVGVDQTLITNAAFLDMEADLINGRKQLVLQQVQTTSNPVDTVWADPSTPNRPAQPTSNVNALDIQFAGRTWQNKVSDVRASLTSVGAKSMVVTSLDEIAWLFNLRGADVAYNPFFLGYAIVNENDVSLYILDKANRLSAQPSDEATTQTLAQHLNTGSDGSCTGRTGECVQVLDYSQALTDVGNLAGPTFVAYDANYAVYVAAQSNRIVGKSPIALAKSKKNSVERAGMQSAYNRDSAALVKFLAFLEKEIEEGTNTWTEVSAGAELDRRRNALQYSRGLSFETISGYGSNGAVIHYRPAAATDKTIGTDSLYLLDSGGQYLDGTTDVTRTMHYGTPTDREKEAYTRVLMSAINLATLKWPEQIYGRQIDAIARYALWEAGLVYRHGTGHGIGAYLSVHEGPGRLSMVHGVNIRDEYLDAYQYFSDEPGYYEDGNFGVRLETIVMVDKMTPKYDTAGEQFYEFKPITFVPFEPKLMEFTYMNAKQVEWLNDYNTQVRDAILPLLTGDQTAIDWLNARTQPISSSVTCGSGRQAFASSVAVALMAAVVCFFKTHMA